VGGVGAHARLDKILGREKWHRTGAIVGGALYIIGLVLPS
jgi:hypothetical protein